MIKHRFFPLITILFVSLFIINGCGKPEKTPIDYVDPLIGTGGHGHTFPGATCPFGMVQLSPDTRLDGWDGCSGYHYSDSIVYGFSHTHLSGTGCSDYGDILLMPTTGVLQMENGSETGVENGYASLFSHKNEKASAGFYSVILDDYNINVSLTTSKRVGLHQYQFQKTKDAHVILDLQHRDKVLESNVEFIGENEIVGYRASQAWANDQRLYFVIRFSRPIESHGIEIGQERHEGVLYASGTNLKAWMNFDMEKNNEPLLVKVGISAVSIENARENIETEMSGWNFDEIRQAAQKLWEKELSKIEVKGGNQEEKVNFYTTLYHSMTAPNLYQDVNGSYRGRDKEIHHADFEYYTVFSLWDTYRALHPLMTIIDEKRTNDFVNTFIKQWEQGGLLPVWELSSCETNCMIGYHAVPVIVDAYRKGIRGYEIEKAYQAVKASAESDIFGLKDYKRQGFVPAHIEGESVSKTLEYAYDDWCISLMAKDLNKTDDFAYFTQRAQYYKNIFDPETHFMRARYGGKWFAPFDVREVNFNYTEANAWQYNFYVPQDINTLITLHGGDEAFCLMLDKMLTETSKTTGRIQDDISGLIGQYAHGNEPSHHMAYLYNFAGKPWKTQALTRRIMQEMYHSTADGLCGNEDCGQMSAWYALSAMGFYPVTPGSNDYIIGSPLFSKITIHLENGNDFVIEAKNNSEKNVYIQSATLNENVYNNSFITHADIKAGGKLTLKMGDKPNEQWGTERPVTKISDHQIVPTPFISTGDNTFYGKTTITLDCIDKNAVIYYTLSTPSNKNQPNWIRYTQPFIVENSANLLMYAQNEITKSQSQTVETSLVKIPENRSIKLFSTYENQYNADGDHALIDGIRGGENFRTGSWQGYYGQDVTAIVDLGTSQKVSYLALGCLQDQRSWIFMPAEVEFFVSNDGKDFKSIGVVKNTVAEDISETVLKNFGINMKPIATRYVKITAKNRGKCPEWHVGAGDNTWIFVDELIIE